MNYISGIITVITFIAVGKTIIKNLEALKEKSEIEKILFSFGLGIGAITIEMFLFSIMNIRWNLFFILSPWLLLIFRKRYQMVSLEVKRFKVPESNIEKVLSLGLIFIMLYALFEMSLRPVVAWDAWANWFIGGKAFYLRGFLDPDYISYANNSNPPVINLMITFTYLIIRKIDDRVALLPFGFFYISLIGILYFEIKRNAGNILALFFTMLFAITPNILRHGARFDLGNSDLPLSYFFLCSFILFKDYFEEKRTSNLILLHIFLGIGALVNSEGVPFFLIINALLIVYVFKLKQFKKIAYCLISLGIVLSWQAFKVLYKLPGNPFITHAPNIARMYVIIPSIIQELLNIMRWNFLWIGFFISVAFIRREFLPYLLIVLLQLFVYIAVYFTTPWNPLVHIQNSFDRLLLHLAPMSLLLIAMIFNDNLAKRKN